MLYHWEMHTEEMIPSCTSILAKKRWLQRTNPDLLLCPKGAALSILWKREKLKSKHVLRSQPHLTAWLQTPRTVDSPDISALQRRDLMWQIQVCSWDNRQGYQGESCATAKLSLPPASPDFQHITHQTQACNNHRNWDGRIPSPIRTKNTKKVVHVELISSSDLLCFDLNTTVWGMNDTKISPLTSEFSGLSTWTSSTEELWCHRGEEAPVVQSVSVSASYKSTGVANHLDPCKGKCQGWQVPEHHQVFYFTTAHRERLSVIRTAQTGSCPTT